ncbi:MAG: hypothetical protein AB9869_38320 [Verrucomicrobiia bacterium]
MKELTALAEPPLPELPPRRMLALQGAGEALRQAGYELVNSIEIRGRRNYVCEITLTRRTAPAFDDNDLIAHHLRQVFQVGGFDVPQENFLVATDDDGLVYLAFLVWFSGHG